MLQIHDTSSPLPTATQAGVLWQVGAKLCRTVSPPGLSLDTPAIRSAHTLIIHFLGMTTFLFLK